MTTPPGDADPTVRGRRTEAPAPPRSLVRIVASADRTASGRVLDLSGATYTVGRLGVGAGQVSDPRLSKNHFRLRPSGRPGAYLIEDLGSSNGTFVDGVAVEGTGDLPRGAVVCAGDTFWVVETEPDPADLPAAKGLDGAGIEDWVGVSLIAQAIRRCLETVAKAEGHVLILGPTGAGKEVAARAIHQHGPRSRGPYEAINCARLEGGLADSALFGHKRGAFTDAKSDNDGAFVRASGGVLLLDEFGELPAPVQAKLLRALESDAVEAIGASSPRAVDVRVVGATNRGLDSLRTDLVARAGTWQIRLPDLAARKADVLPLFRHFWFQFTKAALPELGPDFIERLLLHDWPENVREVRKVALQLSQIASPGAPLEVSQLRIAIPGPTRPRGDPLASGAFTAVGPSERVAIASGESAPVAGDGRSPTRGPERSELEALLAAHQGNVHAIARAKATHPTQVHRWLKRHGLDPKSYRR